MKIIACIKQVPDSEAKVKATVMKFDGTGWVKVGSAGFSAGEVSYTSLAIDNDTPYVAYRDVANSDKTTVMNFVIPDTTAPSVTSFTASTSSTSLDIPITDFTASDDTAVTG